MRSTVLLIAVVAVATVLIGFGVSRNPYFAGDIDLTRWLQGVSPDNWWALLLSRGPTSPAKYFVVGLTIGLAFALAGWRGSLLAILAIALDQYFAEATKAIVARPRPSPLLVNVVGSPNGFSFPSTTMTFYSATLGVLAVLAVRAKTSTLRWPLFLLSVGTIVAAGAARVVLGAHWPSDVILTVAVCCTWIWTGSRLLI